VIEKKMNNYLIKFWLVGFAVIFNCNYGMHGPSLQKNQTKPYKTLISLKFKKPNTYNSGAAVKKFGIGISRTEEDEIWSLFAGFKQVCGVTSKTLSELQLIIKKYGERYPSKRCHILKCANNFEHEYLVFSDKGIDAAFLEEKRMRLNLLEENTCLTAILLGYEENDIKYYYKRCNKTHPYSVDYESDKAIAQKYIQDNIDTIQKWARDNITISYTWPEN
jgi:hypothetical protein